MTALPSFEAHGALPPDLEDVDLFVTDRARGVWPCFNASCSSGTRRPRWWMASCASRLAGTGRRFRDLPKGVDTRAITKRGG